MSRKEVEREGVKEKTMSLRSSLHSSTKLGRSNGKVLSKEVGEERERERGRRPAVELAGLRRLPPGSALLCW